MIEKNNLKTIWTSIHKDVQNTGKETFNMKEIRNRIHCNSITNFLKNIKLKIGIYSFSLAILIGLLSYACFYLKLNLSFSVFLPFILAGLFIISQITKEAIRLFILTKDANNLSCKESAILFRTRVDRILSIDFITILILCYIIAVFLIYTYFINFTTLKHSLSSADITFLLPVFIFILLIIPWIIKKSLVKHYKTLFLNLNETIDFLNDDFDFS